MIYKMTIRRGVYQRLGTHMVADRLEEQGGIRGETGTQSRVGRGIKGKKGRGRKLPWGRMRSLVGTSLPMSEGH